MFIREPKFWQPIRPLLAAGKYFAFLPHTEAGAATAAPGATTSPAAVTAASAATTSPSVTAAPAAATSPAAPAVATTPGGGGGGAAFLSPRASPGHSLALSLLVYYASALRYGSSALRDFTPDNKVARAVLTDQSHSFLQRRAPRTMLRTAADIFVGRDREHSG
ncbi:hypothetical protein BaRGS_00012033 [Batillaria attramentaria]|uniref:Uncharacterized protein n=1 Tax=Batillaria attramentaria TaxID=370345 RepID=A0ABD0LBE7_9CAEN